MDVTLGHPLEVSHSQEQSLAPVPTLSPASNADDNTFSSDSGVLWQCWCIVLATIHGLRLQIIDLRGQANYWQAQHQRAVGREANLKEEKQSLQAQIRDLQRRLYGQKSETSSAADPKSPTATTSHPPTVQRRRRGQQVGTQSHGRRNHDHLPAEHEPCVLPEEQRCCPYCREPFEEIPGTADGTILEVEVRPHRRVYHRQRYRRH
jgi:hypothetical protein